MSVSGVGSSSFFESAWPSGARKVQQDFKQLGQDLQAGNLSAAQNDLATIEQDAPKLAAAAGLAQPPSSSASSSASLSSPTAATAAASSTPSSTSSSLSSTPNTNPSLQAFEQLASDLQSCNLSGAQQDFSTLQQDLQSQASSSHHHHHHGQSQSSESSNSSGNQQSGIVQTFQQLLADLQSGNTSGSQQAYTTLEQDFQQFAKQQGLTTASDGSSSNPPPTTSTPPATDTAAAPDSSTDNSGSTPYSISIQITEISFSVNA